MKPVDYRNETWDQVLERVNESREAVYEALAFHGPCTTRELAKEMGWDILNVRPRVTELCQLDLAAAVDGTNEGVYAAIPKFQAMHAFLEKQKIARDEQLQFAL